MTGIFLKSDLPSAKTDPFWRGGGRKEGRIGRPVNEIGHFVHEAATVAGRLTGRGREIKKTPASLATPYMSTTPWRENAPYQQHRSLYAPDGRRKYLNGDERRAFLKASANEDRNTHTLCLSLAYTGCRISEALSLTVSSLQPGANLIAIRSLKKRGKLVVREIPVPGELVHLLLQGREHSDPDEPLWSFGRTFAWRQVKDVMAKAGITGLHASPQGLRHGFAVSAMLAGVPLTLIQKWLGHASLSTTAIYADVVGPEEREMARRMWK